MNIEFLYFDGCPHAEPARALLAEVVADLAPDAEIADVGVEGKAQAAEVGFLGSPSIRVNGRDLEGDTDRTPSVSCRLYGRAGLPPRWLIEAAILRALGPRGILFLCVANSARSQMAEGIARSLAPECVKVWSAGSQPTQVRPEAIAALQDIGIGMSSHRSKAVSEIPAAEVDTVITLCGEEECPLFLGEATRLHWGLPDPAGVQGDDSARLEAFRQTRDELRRRLVNVFGE